MIMVRHVNAGGDQAERIGRYVKVNMFLRISMYTDFAVLQSEVSKV